MYSFIQTHSAAKTDIGLTRETNEDRFVCDDALKLYVVADGLGGHAAGEVAAEIAVTAVTNFVRSGQNLLVSTIDACEDVLFLEDFTRAAVEHAAAAVYRVSNQRLDCQGMGTTLTMLLVVDHFAIIAHIGDSRLYRVRENTAEQLTQDHTMREMIIQQGMNPGSISPRYDHCLVRSLGDQAKPAIDVRVETLHDGDRFLLCSDGVSNAFREHDTLAALIDDEEDLEAVVDNVILVSNLCGSGDNLTAILVHATSFAPAPKHYPLVDRVSELFHRAVGTAEHAEPTSISAVIQ